MAGGGWARLTDLSYGLRWQAATRPVEVNGRNLVPYDSDLNNWAPSFEVARRLGLHGGVLRAPRASSSGEIFPVTYSQVRFSPPGSVKIAVPAPDLLNPLRADPQKVKGNVYALDPELATPYSYQYNASWEHELGTRERGSRPATWAARSHRLLIMVPPTARARPRAFRSTATIRRPPPRQFRSPSVRWALNGSPRGCCDAARITLIVPQWRGLSLESAYPGSCKAMDLGSAYTLNTAS